MKHVQVIDGAENCEYAIYAFADEQFALIFPEEGQDVEFIEDVLDRLTADQAEYAFTGVWDRRVDKRIVSGIQGTLFFELKKKKIFYPSKRENDMWDGYSIRSAPGSVVTE